MRILPLLLLMDRLLRLETPMLPNLMPMTCQRGLDQLPEFRRHSRLLDCKMDPCPLMGHSRLLADPEHSPLANKC